MNQFTGLGVFLDTYPNAEKSHDVSDDERTAAVLVGVNDCVQVEF